MPAFLTVRSEPLDAGEIDLMHLGKDVALAEVAHAVWFNWLHVIDQTLAAEVHGQTHKPFSLWPVVRRGDHQLEFNIGILSPTLYSSLKRRRQQFAGANDLDLGKFQLRDTLMRVTDAQLSEWVGDETILDMALAVPDRYRHLTFRFLTPTSFRQRGTQLVWPDPRNVWGSLLRRWNEFASVQFPPGLEEELGQLEVSAYELRTRPVRFSGYMVIGFVGYTTYRIPPTLSPACRQPLLALAHYAKYAGVGYKSTMGLGRALWEDGEELIERLQSGKGREVAGDQSFDAST